MDDPREFLPDSRENSLQKGREYAERVRATMSNTFGSPTGRECLDILRTHLVGGVTDPRDRRGEETNDIVRRDTLRDVYLWIEGLAIKRERRRE